MRPAPHAPDQGSLHGSSRRSVGRHVEFGEQVSPSSQRGAARSQREPRAPRRTQRALGSGPPTHSLPSAHCPGLIDAPHGSPTGMTRTHAGKKPSESRHTLPASQAGALRRQKPPGAPSRRQVWSQRKPGPQAWRAGSHASPSPTRGRQRCSGVHPSPSSQGAPVARHHPKASPSRTQRGDRSARGTCAQLVPASQAQWPLPHPAPARSGAAHAAAVALDGGDAHGGRVAVRRARGRARAPLPLNGRAAEPRRGPGGALQAGFTARPAGGDAARAAQGAVAHAAAAALDRHARLPRRAGPRERLGGAPRAGGARLDAPPPPARR